MHLAGAPIVVSACRDIRRETDLAPALATPIA
jgi:hypothetical protein